MQRSRKKLKARAEAIMERMRIIYGDPPWYMDYRDRETLLKYLNRHKEARRGTHCDE